MKLNKTIITFILSITLLFLLLLPACGSEPEPPVEPEPVVEEPAVVEIEPPEEPEPDPGISITRGTWDGDIFTSEYLGLKFLKPDDWHVATDEEIAEIMGIGVDYFSGISDVDLSELMNTASIESVHDMLVSGLDGANVQILYERLIFPNNRMNESQYIEDAAKQLGEMGLEVHFDYPDTYKLAGIQWSTLGSITSVMGSNVYSKYLFNIDEGFVRTIIISYNDDSLTAEQIMPRFFGINDPVPEIEDDFEIGLDEEIIGTWSWKDNPVVKLIFNDDSYGEIAGDPRIEHRFFWTTFEGSLVLSIMGDEGGFDMYKYEIEGDVLTLSNPFDGDEVYIYNRVP